MNIATDHPSIAAPREPLTRSGIPSSGFAVYTSVLLANVIAALARGLLLSIPLGILAFILGYPARDAHILALVGAVWPLVWSVCGLIIPAEGWLIQQHYGGRPPSAREHQRYEQALTEIVARGSTVRQPKSWFVVDQADFAAAVLGDTLLIARVTLHELPLDVVLAHEFGHLKHRDGRVTIATLRLTPFAAQLEGRPKGPGLFAGLARLALYVASGQLSMRLTTPIWAGYYRRCEYRADAYAAQLGYASELIDYFEGVAVNDQPVPFAWMKQHTEPPAELRIDRLQAHLQLALFIGDGGAGGDEPGGGGGDIGRGTRQARPAGVAFGEGFAPSLTEPPPDANRHSGRPGGPTFQNTNDSNGNGLTGGPKESSPTPTQAA